MEKQPHSSAFTVDVEDGISITMRDSYNIDIKPTERVVENTRRILELLDKKSIKGTFFILGIVAEYYPQLIKEIANEKHELGIHGYSHLVFSKMDRELAFQELDSAKKLVEDLTGLRVYGHRAPAFSINPDTAWGLDVISEAGFMYDSSIVPIKSERYGWPDFSKTITRVTTPKGKELIEVPLSSTKFMGYDIPACGGRYFQILPYGFTKNAMNKIIEDRPAIFYMHPYEIDVSEYPDYYHDALKKAGLRKQLQTYIKWINRNTFYGKIERLISQYRFDTVRNIIRNYKAIEPDKLTDLYNKSEIN